MIWLAWRQFRVAAAVALAALIGFTALLAVSGRELSHLYAVSKVPGCHGSACIVPASTFLTRTDVAGPYVLVYLLGLFAVLLAPALIGMFWGAPLLAREFEAGTHQLAWSQTVTRARWLGVKLAIPGATAIAVTEACGLLVTWWATPITTAVALGGYGGDPLIDMNEFGTLLFPASGVTPLAYATFAFVLGVLLGAVVRRTVPAMAITLALYVVLQIAMPLWVRPHLFPPDHAVTTLSSVVPSSATDVHFGVSGSPAPGSGSPGTARFDFTAVYWSRDPEAWILSSGVVNAAGKPVSTVPAACLSTPTEPVFSCLSNHGVRIALTYQPAGRYWALQGVEAGIYLALAAVMAAYCFWRLERRRA